LQIGIGDLSVSFAPAALQPSDVYRRFTVETDPPDLVLEFREGKIPDFPREEAVFDAEVLWSCYKAAGRYIFRDVPLARKRPRTVLSIAPDFKSGAIYARPATPSENLSLFPFRYPLDQIVTVHLLSRHGGMLAHTCGITFGGAGVLFPGVSAAGKSTMSRLWGGRRGVTVLNDDRVVIRKKDNGFWIYGTPWHGDAKLYAPDKARLRKIFFLKHGRQNEIRKVDPLDAAGRLIVCSFSPFWDKEGMEVVAGLCSELAQKVPCHELTFVPDESVVELLETVI